MSRVQKLKSWCRWGASLALLSIPIGCAPLDEGEEAEVSMIAGAAVANIRIAGHVGAGRVGVGAVSVTIGGEAQKTVLTDANGNFRFDVQPGTYTLAFSKAGAALNPPSINLGQQTASSFRNVSCTAGCGAPAAIVPGRELVITDTNVVNDPRSSNVTTGPWSFRALMRDMAPAGVDENAFTISWLNQLRNGGSVNGFPVDPRNTQPLGFVADASGKLNWGNQMRLVAIVNRTDLHPSGAGELRFVYGGPNNMTVIFEYGLPATRDRKGWATLFHTLASLAPSDPAFRARLQSITDQVVRRNLVPAKPNGNAINQVRVNEILLATGPSPNWQLREFRLPAGGGLTLAPTAGTPNDTANTAGSALNVQLASFINSNVVNLQGAFVTVPVGMTGGQSSEPVAAANTFWSNFSVQVNATARHAFAGATCNGCHFSEVNRNLPPGTPTPQNVANFYHISPTGAVSPLMTTVEIPRRAIFAQHMLSCGATCATGAEALLP